MVDCYTEAVKSVVRKVSVVKGLHDNQVSQIQGIRMICTGCINPFNAGVFKCLTPVVVNSF